MMTAMPHDAYGLDITSDSATARQTYDRAVRALLGWEATTLDLFREAITHDPALALAHSGAAVCLFLEERFGEARAATEAARAAVAEGSARERSHVEALAYWTSGNVVEAERAMRAHVAAFPRDL